MAGIGPRVARLAFCVGIFCAETADSYPDTRGHTGSQGGTRDPTRLPCRPYKPRGCLPLFSRAHFLFLALALLVSLLLLLLRRRAPHKLSSPPLHTRPS